MRFGRVVPVGVLVTALVTGAAAVPAASAAEAQAQAVVTVIANKLNNPRGIAVGMHDRLYVAEAGKGGKGKCIPSPEGAGEVCFGTSGALVSIALKKEHGKPGKPKRIVTGLPSLARKADGSFALGLHDVAPLFGGKLLATVGGAVTPEVRTSFGKKGQTLNHVVCLQPESRAGKVLPVADLAAYEFTHNPDAKDPGSAKDSNSYGILATPHGAFVTDAGGNDLLKVDEKGAVSTVAVFRSRIVPAPPGIPGLPKNIPMQAVPTTVTKGPDGTLYVAELTGFPFVKGAARIWRIKHGQPPKLFATGFTNIVDIAWDHRGGLLVLQISKEGLLAGDTNGALIRIGGKGRRTELAAGRLTFPGGLAVGPDGAIYVTNKSVFAGQGEVLRIA